MDIRFKLMCIMEPIRLAILIGFVILTFGSHCWGDSSKAKSDISLKDIDRLTQLLSNMDVNNLARDSEATLNEHIKKLTVNSRSFQNEHKILRAQFLAGVVGCLYGKSRHQIEKGRELLAEIYEEYPESFEGTVGQYLQLSSELYKKTDKASRENMLGECLASINSALNYIEEVDKNKDDISLYSRRIICGGRGDVLKPAFLLDMSSLSQKLGKYDEARKRLEEAARDYPSTIWSKKAKIRLKSMRIVKSREEVIDTADPKDTGLGISIVPLKLVCPPGVTPKMVNDTIKTIDINGRWVVRYRKDDENVKSIASYTGHDQAILLQPVEELGGELLLSYKSGNTIRPWAYIENVQKRHLALHDASLDATLTSRSLRQGQTVLAAKTFPKAYK